ncbi:6-hydroxymethylpterin diphosphokinase MptE-like protein [Synechococcus sp. MU1651]|uniref:motility associated factor glycosyltransferase family protein n=1 Tax=Synechococcus sp. MU1651 TaxID=2508353 RepID=UPI002026FF62|nr:6-hydroxymethylpterin diphosphokinase MptE-like protein [Synechococcus sp. MU1651]
MKALEQLGTDLLETNRLWLNKMAPSLASLVTDHQDDCVLRSRSVDADQDLFFRGERVLEACHTTLQSVLKQQLERTDGVAMTRIMRSADAKSASSTKILSQMVDVHREVLFDYLPSFPYEGTPEANEKPSYKNLILFGSLMLLPLYNYLNSLTDAQWISITLVEDDPLQLKASLSLFNLPDFVSLCRERKIGLTLHIDENKIALQDRLFSQVGKENPTLLYGWQVLRSPVLSPDLMELHSWLHAPEGAAQHVSGLLGFATDDFNQTQQALWNALTNKGMKVLSPGCLDSDTPIVLVASGPSLTEELPWLRKHAAKLNIVAAGSALGSLLRAGVKPSAVVCLERSAETYTDLIDLLAEGLSLKDIDLIVSSTIDPRLPKLFKNVCFFHRPASASAGLFPDDANAVLRISGPHVINAALEAVLALGSRRLLFVGADFSAASRSQPRAEGALGVSPREFAIPVKGNKGKTVFSEPGLMHTSYLLNRMIEVTPDCIAKRLGQGVILSNVESVDDSDALAAEFSLAPGALRRGLLSLPYSSFTVEDCDALFDLLLVDLAEIITKLQSVIESSNGWSKDLADSLSPLLQRLHDGDSRQRRILSQLLCQPLFYSAMSMYDSLSKHPETFAVSKDNFLSSLRLLDSVVTTWLTVMRPWLHVPELPSWDPEWLRTRYRRMDSQQA